MNSPLKIWLADDDNDDQEIFREVTNQLGVQLECSSNGIELIGKLKKSSAALPDFIFLDLNMPLKGGLECLSEIKKDEVFSNIPVIMYTTSAPFHLVEEAMNLGAAKFLEKPSNLEQLKINLAEVFQTAGHCVVMILAATV